MYLLFYWEGLRHLTSMLVFGSDLLVLHNYDVIISECQKVTFLVVKFTLGVSPRCWLSWESQ